MIFLLLLLNQGDNIIQFMLIHPSENLRLCIATNKVKKKRTKFVQTMMLTNSLPIYSIFL